MKKCIKCGHSNNDHFKFCQKCGTALNDVGVMQQNVRLRQNQMSQSQMSQSQIAGSKKSQGSQKKDDKTVLKIVLIAAAALLVIVVTVILLLYLGGSNKDQNDDQIVFKRETEETEEERTRRHSRETKDMETETQFLTASDTENPSDALAALAETQLQPSDNSDILLESEIITDVDDHQAEWSNNQHNYVSVEDEVLVIRDKYNTIVSNISAGKYEKVSLDQNVTAHYDSGDLKAVIAPLGTNGIQYRQFYYYDQGQLIFAYYENVDSHRFYFYENQLMRWRYCYDATNTKEAVNYDWENSYAYRDWETIVLDEAYAY